MKWSFASLTTSNYVNSYKLSWPHHTVSHLLIHSFYSTTLNLEWVELEFIWELLIEIESIFIESTPDTEWIKADESGNKLSLTSLIQP